MLTKFGKTVWKSLMKSDKMFDQLIFQFLSKELCHFFSQKKNCGRGGGQKSKN